MSRVAIITNIPSPYRVDLYDHLQKNYTDNEYHIIYTAAGEDNRSWSVDKEKLGNSTILDSTVIKVRGRLDDRYIHLPLKIIPALDRIAPDVVIAMEYNPAAIQALLWCRLHKKKFIHLTDGTLLSEQSIGRVQKFLRKFIITRSDACIASSTKAKEKLLFWGADERKIFISLLTMDIRQFTDDPKDGSAAGGRGGRSNTILYVGSFVKRKGLDLLFSALKKLNCDYELHIVGNGTEEDTLLLKKTAEDLGIDDKIKWCGFKTGRDLVEEYKKAGVFVLPTRVDCYGLVLLEALCAGTGIVSSKYADGAYDIVSEGETGYIVDPYNAEEMAGAIQRIVEDEALQRAFAAKNPEAADRFSFAAVSEGYEDAVRFVTETQDR